MTNLEFRDYCLAGIVRQRWYNMNDLVETSITSREFDEYIPYIMSNTGFHTTETKNVMRLTYCTSDQYLSRGARRLTPIKVVLDVLDSAKVPVIVHMGAENFLVGKGLVAKYTRDVEPEFLFVACKRKKAKSPSMEDIVFYVSKDAFSDSCNKDISRMIKMVMEKHTGDVLISNDISTFIGHTIPYPKFDSISKKQEYLSKLTDFCTEKIRKSLI